MCVIIGAYLREAFELAGVRDAKVAERACCRAGAPACEWRIEWTPDPAASRRRADARR
jgi:predicted hydrocarbon binding protein